MLRAAAASRHRPGREYASGRDGFVRLLAARIAGARSSCECRTHALVANVSDKCALMGHMAFGRIEHGCART
eukprot:scaffold2135_cov341-Prasinococcus_capsulatus_cf.AAC.2